MRVHGRGLVLGFVVMLGLTLVGEPAPTSIGGVELLLVAGVGLMTLVAVAGVRHGGHLRIGPSHSSILAVTAACCLSLLAGMTPAIVAGAEPSAIVRASGPYLLFLPLAAAGPWLGGVATAPAAVRALVVAGLAQGIFLLSLFATGVQDVLDLRAVFLGRTTLLDARTTVPLFLASAILPLAWIAEGRGRTRLIALAVVALSAAGALSTQTRSQLVALAMGGVVFLPCYGLWWARRTGRTVALAARRVVMAGLAALVLAAGAVATVPTLRVLVQSVALRTAADQDNGRIANEWVPAFRQVSDSPGSMLVGIGAGRTFVTAEGEERTYVHNLGLYALVYGGLLGLVVTVLFYLVVAGALVRRLREDPGLESAALLALLAALATYAQFFAVHKLLSYNLMLALIAAAAAAPRFASRPATRQ